MEKKKESKQAQPEVKGLIRDLPILKSSNPSYELAGDIEYLFQSMVIGTVPITEEYSEDYGATCHWHGSIEIHVIKHAFEYGMHHFDIGIRLVSVDEAFKYTQAPDDPNEKRLWINPIDVEMQRDIAKDAASLLIAFIYYAQKKADEMPNLLEDVRKVLVPHRFSIDCVVIEEENDKLEGWLDTIGCNLMMAYLDKQITLTQLIHGNLYIVYGEFDPATRTNLLDKPGIPVPDAEK